MRNLDQKADDVDSVMKSFNGLIEASFNDAEARARDVGSVLARASEHAVETIAQQFAQVRDETGKERERTVMAMRAAYEQATQEVQQLFAQSLERFRASTTEMRGMAQEIQREINLARDEVQRGAAELPRETAEQAAAMRRVVVEQMKALNDLTDLVQRANRGYDVAEPVMASPRTEAPRRAPARAHVEPVGPAIEEAPLPPAQPLRPRPAPAAPRAPQNERGPGWLSDLLARASKDEGDVAVKAPARDAISLDLARMVDANGLADAWERYYRNERNAFTRRVYTAQGLGTFDELRRRYGSDADFRDSVDRYAQEFERVLAEAARDDRDGSRTRSYLLSEQGKVYTMLAHAAGRLD